jgi:glycosyltransferase involved in cell wall biosynthesis
MAGNLALAWRKGLASRPQVWLTYHTYYKSPDVIGPWVSSRLGIPYVLFQPMYATRRRKMRSTRMGFHLNRLAIEAAGHAFVNNEADLEALRRALPADRITYLPPGIYPEEFRRDEVWGSRIRETYGIPGTAPLLLTAARFRADVKFHSLVYLFRALAFLHEEGQTPFVLMVIGDGPKEEELRRLAADLLPGRVIFTGRIPRLEMVRFYSAADLFVFPGIGESLGMVYLEAQAAGLPVVALDVAGVSQVVRGSEGHRHRQTGILVPQDDGRTMAEAVKRLLDDPNLRSSLARNAVGYVQEARNLHHNYAELSSLLEGFARRV